MSKTDKRNKRAKQKKKDAARAKNNKLAQAASKRKAKELTRKYFANAQESIAKARASIRYTGNTMPVID